MLLMTPGPVAVDERIIEAMNRPAIAHYHPEYFDVFNKTMEMLKSVFGTSGDVIILPGSGRVGMEASIVSIADPGDRILCIVTGTFGRWFVQIAKRARCKVRILEGKWGGAINPEEVEKILKEEEFKAVTVVHSETSTGACNPIETVGKICKDYEVLHIVDAISSLGCMNLNMDKMNIDLCLSASQKGIGGIVGLALVGVSDRAYKVMKEKKEISQSFALDLKRWRDQFFGHEYPRPYPVIPSTHLVYALNEACKLIMEEGLENRLSRCRKVAQAVRKSMIALGLELFPEERDAADSLTAVKPPEGISDSDIVHTMREKYDVMIGGSIFELKGKLFRISHMGVQASMNYLVPTLAALERTLVDLGYKVKFGTGVGRLIESL